MRNLLSKFSPEKALNLKRNQLKTSVNIRSSLLVQIYSRHSSCNNIIGNFLCKWISVYCTLIPFIKHTTEEAKIDDCESFSLFDGKKRREMETTGKEISSWCGMRNDGNKGFVELFFDKLKLNFFKKIILNLNISKR